MPRKPDGEDNAADQEIDPRGEVYVEYRQVGQTMKVIAVDAATGTEVVIMGPASASQNDLQRIAVRKLKTRLGKAAAGTEEVTEKDDGDEPGPKGWIA